MLNESVTVKKICVAEYSLYISLLRKQSCFKEDREWNRAKYTDIANQCCRNRWEAKCKTSEVSFIGQSLCNVVLDAAETTFR